MDSVRQWLEQLGLPQHAEVFERNAIDPDVLCELTDKDLENLGVHALGHRKKLLKAIAELNGRKAATAAAVPFQTSRTLQERESAGTAGERRQLTVLFCDMVGFTELANRVDPEVLREIIRSYEDACAVCVSRYEGYVFQRLGDGIVAFFGYPLAHEGEAERAIRAAMQIVESLSGLEVADVGHLAVRIGIATGLVVVSSADKSAVGETMNLASRLQGIAPVGSIVVSERVHRLAGGSFDYEDLGEQALKGISRPTHAFRILGPSAAASRFEAATQEGLTPLVGREPEIGHLVERWQLAREGEGQVVLLSGEPGIGKSRILSALRERLQNEVKGTLRFQCSPYYGNSAFYPIIDNFERALQFGRDEAAGSKLDKLEALVVRQRGRPLADVRFIASILSIPTDERYGPLPMTPQKQKDETIRVLVDLTEAAARREPSLMLFEDAHWADPTTLEVLDLLIERIRQVPLLVVITHRPEFQSRWPGREHVTTLNLSKLTRLQSSAMVSKLAGGKALPAELHEQIIAKTDGVPLFVEELTKSVLESTVLRDAGDHYVYAGAAGAVTIPATLRDSLMARLDRFMPVKEIAQIGAAIGREFSYELIAAVAPMTQTHLDDGLRRLTESGLAFRRGTPPEATYTFKHALVQDAAYDSLLKSRRQVLHGKIARVLEEQFPATMDTEPELLAHHHTAAGNTEQAIGYWRKAGELALQRMALNECISHLGKGLEIVTVLEPSKERDEKELGIRTLLGTAWMALRGWPAPEAEANFRPALKLAKVLDHRPSYLPILFGLWVNDLSRGHIAESHKWVVEILSAAESFEDSDLRIMGHGVATCSHFFLGDFQQARRQGERIPPIYDAAQGRRIENLTNHDPLTVMGIWTIPSLWMLGYPDQAVALFDATEKHVRERNQPFGLCWVLIVGTWVFALRNEPDQILRYVDEGERLSRAHSLPLFSDVLAPMYRGKAWILSGRRTEGITTIRNAIKAWSAIGAGCATPDYQASLAYGVALDGDIETGLKLLDNNLEQIGRPGWEERGWLAETLRLKGWMLQLQDKTDEAKQSLLDAIDIARQQQAKSWELRASTTLAHFLAERGDRGAARNLLEPIYNWFTEGFDTKDLKDARTLLKDLEA